MTRKKTAKQANNKITGGEQRRKKKRNGRESKRKNLD